MIALYIIGGILLLFGLLFSPRVGVQVEFGETLKVKAKVGPGTITLLPKKATTGKKKEEKREKSPKKKEQKGEKKKPGLTASDIRSAIPVVWESLQKGLKKSGRNIRIDPLTVSVIFGGEDPADVAEWYGWASSFLWTAMPWLEKKVQIPHPGIHLGMDFNATKIKAEGKFGIWCRVGGLFAVGHAFAKPLLKWFLATKKQKKPAQPKVKNIPEENNKTAA